MVDATTAPAALPADLDALVPRSSRWRAVALIALALAVLAGAWFSSTVLRPSLDDGSGSGSGAKEFPGQVLIVSDTAVRAWPSATLEGIDDVPGAHVAAAWLVDTALMPDAVAMYAENPLAVVQTTYPEAGLVEGGNLPAEFRSGTTYDLVILWDIEDCTVLNDEEEALATIRTAIGTTARAPIPWAARPAHLFDTTLDDDEPSSLACTPTTP